MSLLGKKDSDKPCSTIDTLIGIKADIKGDVHFSGGLRVDGKIKGNIVARGDGDASSTLVLSEQAVVTGNISVPHMVINGTVKGSIHASERIVLQSKAEITGDVTYKTIEIALGATINGNLVREQEKANVTKLKPVSTVSTGGGQAGEPE